jgi:site-specific DNA-cytosine methylase
MLFVSLFAGVMVVCRALDKIGFGSVVAIKE